MSSGERPISAAKGKQSDTEALCQPARPQDRPSPPSRPQKFAHPVGGQYLNRSPPCCELCNRVFQPFWPQHREVQPVNDHKALRCIQ